MRKLVAVLLILTFIFSLSLQVHAQNSFPETGSPSVILVDSKTGQIMYEKNIHEKLYPASITKVMTALITLEKCKLDEKVTASKRAVFEIESDSNNVGFEPDEELTVEQLLYALMLESANEAANILAEHIGGSIEGFADIMNSRAKELGALNTNFVTPNGLHNDNHYTTVYDMSLIARKAMTIPEFRRIVQTREYTMSSTNKNKKIKQFFCHNRLMLRSTSYYYPYAIGIKTGYTTKAGNSLIACATKNNMELIAVTMNSRIENGTLLTYSDSTKLFEHVFNNYEVVQPTVAGSIVKQIIVPNAADDNQLQIAVENGTQFILPKNSGKQGYTVNEVIDSNLSAPIAINTKVGYLQYLVDNKVVSVSNLVAANNIQAKPSNDGVKIAVLKVLKLLRNVAIALLIFFVLFFIWVRLKRRGMRRKQAHLMKIERLIKD